MDTSRWETVQRIFNAIADIEPARRAETLGTLCAGDPALLEQVSAMLTEDSLDDFLLHADLSRFARATLLPLQLTSMVETHIGRYRLPRLLGEGGMGVVYLAERTDIGGLVAIKLLRDAWLSPVRRQRFLQEQQLLVKLVHPGIARIYDANSTEDGIPWFVMEYADGLPLIDFLHGRGGSARDDLLLFRTLCEAVQYAHSRAIIHRDRKNGIARSMRCSVTSTPISIAGSSKPDPLSSCTRRGSLSAATAPLSLSPPPVFSCSRLRPSCSRSGSQSRAMPLSQKPHESPRYSTSPRACSPVETAAAGPPPTSG